MSENRNTSSSTSLAVVKFFAFSAVGVAAFFLPVGGRIPIDHLTSFLYGIFSPYYNYLVLLFCVLALLQSFVLQKTYRRSRLDFVLSLCQAAGTVVVLSLLAGLAPGFLAAADVGPATVVNMGKSIIMIFCAAFFLPFLLDYGLIDAVGVLAKPVMRPVFKVPGLTAVIAASTFLGNFSIGLLSANSLYKEGKLTYKETAIVATGFSTISIGLMLLFSQLLKISEHFLFYFVSTAVVTYIVTAITVRIPPLGSMTNGYYDKPSPIAEDDVKGDLKNAWKTGIGIAGAAPSPFATVGAILRSTLRVLANMISSSMFIIVLGLLLNKHTPIFSWLGTVFSPIFSLFGVPNAPVLTKACGLAIMDVIPAVMFGSAQELAPAARYVLAAFPVSVIIFIGGYFTCLMATDIRIRVRDLFFLWLERMFLSLIFYSAIAVAVF